MFIYRADGYEFFKNSDQNSSEKSCQLMPSSFYRFKILVCTKNGISHLLPNFSIDNPRTTSIYLDGRVLRPIIKSRPSTVIQVKFSFTNSLTGANFRPFLCMVSLIDILTDPYQKCFQKVSVLNIFIVFKEFHQTQAMVLWYM